MISKISDIGKWVKDFVMKLFNKIISLFKKGLVYVLAFFGLEPVVTVEGDVTEEMVFN